MNDRRDGVAMFSCKRECAYFTKPPRAMKASKAIQSIHAKPPNEDYYILILN